MKRLTSSFWYSLYFVFVIFIVSSCKKDALIQHDVDESYTVNFKFKEFGTAVTPLGMAKLSSKALFKTASLQPAQTQNTQEGYLYYWSFNSDNTVPDIRVANGAKIAYNGGETPDDFATGWSYDTYRAGKALSLKGVEELVFELPLKQVLEVQSIGFDIGSSDTGPKSFDLLYSQDGINYFEIQSNNQFTNTNTPQAKNTFTFHIDTIELDFEAKLFLKIIPLTGERGNAKDYNPTTGVMKIDNFRLVGISETVNGATVFKLHYHIFDAVSKSLIMAGEEAFAPGQLPDLSLTLPVGDYYASFVTNISNAELEVPEQGSADEYSIANPFSNYRAQVFGAVDTFSVRDDITLDLVLGRYYSQVKFEFTDTRDLSRVDRIIITPMHDPYFYAPFSNSMTNPVLDQSDMTIVPDFANNSKEIVFNQFMGHIWTPGNLSYTVEVYDTDNVLLRTFTVSAAVRNNVQLVFRGELLGGVGTDAHFTIAYDETWEGEVEEDF